MTGQTIPQLPGVASLTGQELVPLVQGGVTMRASVTQIAGLSTPNVVAAQIQSALAANPAVIPNGANGTPNLALVTDPTAGIVFSVATLAAMKALTARPAVVEVATGQAQGAWAWYAGDSTTADDALVVQCTSGTAGRYKRIFNGPIYAEWFGLSTANGGSANSTAINAALTAASSAAITVVVIGSAGTFSVTETINIPSLVSLVGAGVGVTTLQNTSAATPLITLGANSYTVVSDMTLDRSTPATSGGHGITAPSLTGICAFRRLYIMNQYVGLNLGPTANGDIENILIENCYSHGLAMTNSASSGLMQWRLRDILSQKNGARGFSVTSANTGPTQITMGTWAECYTYANAAIGMAFVADPNVPIQGLRLLDCFVGEDGNTLLYLDTYGTGHLIDGCYFELAGTTACGRNLATSAPNVGYGIELRPNNTIVELSGSIINGNSYSGVKSQATKFFATAVTATNNGQASVSGERIGFNVAAGAGSFANCKAFNTGARTSQLYGLNVGVDAIQMVGCDLQGNATGPLFQTVSVGNGSSFCGCLPQSVNAYSNTNGNNATFSGLVTFNGTESQVNNAAGVTLTAAQFASGLIVRFGAAGVSDTTPTAAQIVASIPNCVVGSAYDLAILNANSGTLTIVAGSGITLLGTTAIATGHTRIYRVFVTNATPSSEAVSFRGYIEAPN